MKRSKLSQIMILLLAAPGLQVPAQTTAFTFQGRLLVGSTPANGDYDVRFYLRDSLALGNPVGTTNTVAPVAVTNGLFTVMLDFGAGIFTGLPCWLEIGVRTNGSADAYTTLSPRQPLTATPYAVYAPNAGTATNANAVSAGSITASSIASGQVVKTLNGLKDNVSITGGANVTITTNGSNLQLSAPASGLALPYNGTATSAASLFTLANSGSGPAGVFFGKVGIGTINPQAQLHVAATNGNYGQLGTATAGVVGYATGLGAPQGVFGSGYHGIHGEGVYGVVGINTNSGGGVGVYASAPSAGTPVWAQGDGVNPQIEIETLGTRAAIELFTSSSPPWDMYATFDPSAPTLRFRNGFSSDPDQMVLGTTTLAAGHRAKANLTGDFVWADNSVDADFVPGTANSFSARAAGGVNFYSSANLTSGVFLPAGGNSWAAVSDRNAKENLQPINAREILARVVELPVLNYNMKTQDPAIRHLGPMAQDFYAAFQIGEDDTHITTVDADGVALAAIQGLNQRVDEKEAELREIRKRNRELEARLEALEKVIGQTATIGHQ